MQLSTTFRHMEASQAVRQYAEERLAKIRKYFHKKDLIAAHAVFSVERNHHHTVELVITLPNGLVVQACETTDDMYSSIDLVGSRIERQVRRWKERIRDHKSHGPSVGLRQRVFSADTFEPTPVSLDQHLGGEHAGDPGAAPPADPTPPPAPAFKVIKEQTFTVRTMRVDDAVMQMNLLETDFLVFNDVDSQGISVVYRRKDGNYGLIEAGRATIKPS